MSDRGPSFPCIVCGRHLERVFEEEGQPSNGVTCSTRGNYGSTVFDPMDGTGLAFNICDPCVVEKSEEGYFHATRTQRPIRMKLLGDIGWQRVERPYAVWKHSEYMASGHRDDALVLDPDDDACLDGFDSNCQLNFTVSELHEMYDAAVEHRKNRLNESP